MYVDKLGYNSVALDLFIMEMDDNEIVQSVIIPAINTTFARIN